jgi:hypothetical protein
MCITQAREVTLGEPSKHSFMIGKCQVDRGPTLSRRTVLTGYHGGSAQGQSRCADHRPLDPAPSHLLCHEGLVNAKYTEPLRLGTGRAGPGPGRPPCRGTGSPVARHFGGSRLGAPCARRVGGRSLREEHGGGGATRPRCRCGGHGRPVRPWPDGSSRPQAAHRAGHGRGERACRSRRGEEGARACHCRGTRCAKGRRAGP